MVRQSVVHWVVLGGMGLLALALLALVQMKGAGVLQVAGEALAADASLEPAPTLQPAAVSEVGSLGTNLPEISTATVLTRTVSINPASFTRDVDSTTILMDNDIAMRWAAGSSDEAGFYLRRPSDWNPATPVKVHLYFALGGSSAGAVNWRLKLNTYTPNSGEWLTNPATRDADAILNFADGPSWYRIYSQTFTLQPSAFHDEPLWSFFFLRGSGANGETFPGYLYLLDVEVEYQVVSPISALFMPYVVRP